jgi:hypothetical protein
MEFKTKFACHRIVFYAVSETGPFYPVLVGMMMDDDNHLAGPPIIGENRLTVSWFLGRDWRYRVVDFFKWNQLGCVP